VTPKNPYHWSSEVAQIRLFHRTDHHDHTVKEIISGKVVPQKNSSKPSNFRAALDLDWFGFSNEHLTTSHKFRILFLRGEENEFRSFSQKYKVN
jgi:hypothetical protein